jgi:NAD(P)-dependent dehydrogenase (short-subunit alcohol dehydrogenase family)
MFDLKGQVIVITGGETGIGLATVEHLAAAGAQVIMGGILEDKGTAAAAEISAKGGKVDFIHTDVRDLAQVERLVNGSVEKYGKIDGLICNAGIFDGFAGALETTDHLWEQIMNINVRGTFYACRAALRHMTEAGKGKIVNVASVGGLIGAADGASYTASKHAVIGLTKQMACDYAKQGIHINTVCPGTIQTDMRGNTTRILGDEAPRMGGVGVDPDWLQRTVPMQRKGKPADIADMILFLLSDKSDYIVGQNFVVDGGWTAK